MNILVVRNDKLGDFMLAWPALATLKLSMPSARITALLPAYTADLGRACPWIDAVIEDRGNMRSLRSELKQHSFDAMLTFFSTTRVAWLGFKLRIPQRIAPATKLAQLFYPNRLIQRRSRSIKAEYDYNIDLVRHFLELNNKPVAEVPPPYWSLDSDKVKTHRQTLLKQFGIETERPMVFVHPGNGGSANNLSLTQYAELIQQTQNQLSRPVHWILTAGPGESDMAYTVRQQAQSKQVDSIHVLESKGSIEDFAYYVANAHAFIAGSTGTLHLAGALDIPTVGFFPNSRACNSIRWRPCNSEAKHLSLSPHKPQSQTLNDEQLNDMSTISIEDCAAKINVFIQTNSFG